MFDTKSEALFKEADKLLDVEGPSLPNESDQAPPLILVRPLLPMIHVKQY